MPNGPVPAAARGLPEINRRTLLVSLAAAPGACVPIAAAAHASRSIDPLLELIAKYRREMAAFNARAAAGGSNEDWDALTEETYGPPYDRLRLAPPSPTTFAGACAGLDFVLSELVNPPDSDANENVLRVCADFLRHQPEEGR